MTARRKVPRPRGRFITMHRDAIGSVVLHARRARPREACGLLVGAGAHVTFAVPIRNIARGRTRFLLDPAEHIALRRVLRAVTPRIEILGVYHSHPNGAASPSATDVAEALYPGWVHLIVGLAGRTPALGAFRLDGGRVQRVRLLRQ